MKHKTVIKLIYDYSCIASEAKYKTIHEKRIKVLMVKQMLNELVIALVQIKVNTFRQFFNELCQIICFCIKQRKLLKKN